MTVRVFADERSGKPRYAAAARFGGPPVGNTGGKSTRIPTSGREASLDALRFSGPRHAMPMFVRYFQFHCGLGAPTRREAGGCFLPDGLEWGDIKLFYDGRSDGKDHFVVEMMGGGCALLNRVSRVDWLVRYAITNGCKFSRLDIAIDLYGVNQRIIDRAIASCEAGEGVQFKVWERRESFSDKGHGRTVYFGARGDKGSGRYGRLYEKGVQSGKAEAGRWIRYEVEFHRDCAQTVAGICAHGTFKDAVACAYGAFDFRRKARNAGERANARRRKQCGWWAEFIGSCHAVLVRAKARTTTIEGYRSWVHTAVMPGVASYAKVLGLSVEKFLQDLCGGKVDAVPAKMRSQIGREFDAFFREVVPI
ncbi:MAG: replication initiation factor domain-containing protein [Phycisphaerales bacterium]